MTPDARTWRAFAALLLLIPTVGLLAEAPSFVAPPLTEMGLSQSYLGFWGGLYPGGSNVPPPAHAARCPKFRT